MNRFGIGLAVGVAIGVGAMINTRRTKQIVKKVKNVLNI